MKTKYKIMWYCTNSYPIRDGWVDLYGHLCTTKRQMERFIRENGNGLMRVVLK